ncbi:MAG: hypothetical protein Q9227_003508 [Pyrenula ochraceoflavens]
METTIELRNSSEGTTARNSENATRDAPEITEELPAYEEEPQKKWYYSLKGDPRWIDASPNFTAYAPHVVIVLFVLSLIEIVIGTLWIVQYNQGMTFQGIIQPIIIPVMSFFNTVPSGHLHLFAHVNPPMLAISFSSILALCYLLTAIMYVASCRSGTPRTLQKAECYRNFDNNGLGGPTKGIWGAVVAFAWLSFVGYTLHAYMAWVVWGWMKRRPRDEHGMVIDPNMDPAKKARREALARERWRKMGSEFA